MTPINSGKLFDAACASDIQEKPHPTSYALHDLLQATMEQKLLRLDLALDLHNYHTDQSNLHSIEKKNVRQEER